MILNQGSRIVAVRGQLYLTLGTSHVAWKGHRSLAELHIITRRTISIINDIWQLKVNIFITLVFDRCFLTLS